MSGRTLVFRAQNCRDENIALAGNGGKIFGDTSHYVVRVAH